MGKLKRAPEGFIGTELRLVGRYACLQERIEREAEAEGLAPLTVDHWAVIQVVLDFYEAHGRTPAAVRIGRAVGIGPRALRTLFPAGAVRTVFRLAGLELPDGPVGEAEILLN